MKRPRKPLYLPSAPAKPLRAKTIFRDFETGRRRSRPHAICKADLRAWASKIEADLAAVKSALVAIRRALRRFV